MSIRGPGFGGILVWMTRWDRPLLWGIATLGASAILLGGAEAAVAHNNSTSTTVVIAGNDIPRPGTLAVYGYLDTSEACRANRVVNLFARYLEWTHRHVLAPGEWTLADKDRSSLDGFYVGGMADYNLMATKVVVTRKNLGRPGHRHICQGDSEGLVTTRRASRPD